MSGTVTRHAENMALILSVSQDTLSQGVRGPMVGFGRRESRHIAIILAVRPARLKSASFRWWRSCSAPVGQCDGDVGRISIGRLRRVQYVRIGLGTVMKTKFQYQLDSAIETMDVSRLEDFYVYNTLAYTPSATLHRHPHHHAHALCSTLQSQEHPHTPGGSGLGSHVVTGTTGRTSCGTPERLPTFLPLYATPPRATRRAPLPKTTAVAAMVVLCITGCGTNGRTWEHFFPFLKPLLVCALSVQRSVSRPSLASSCHTLVQQRTVDIVLSSLTRHCDTSVKVDEGSCRTHERVSVRLAFRSSSVLRSFGFFLTFSAGVKLSTIFSRRWSADGREEDVFWNFTQRWVLPPEVTFACCLSTVVSVNRRKFFREASRRRRDVVLVRWQVLASVLGRMTLTAQTRCMSLPMALTLRSFSW